VGTDFVPVEQPLTRPPPCSKPGVRRAPSRGAVVGGRLTPRLVSLGLWAGLLCGLLSSALAQPAAPGGVELLPLPAKAGYEEARSPGALQLACAADPASLESFFAARGLPFDAGLIRNRGRRRCHIFFEPTLPGFRAAPENLPTSELFFDLETLNFLTLRTERFGDALDITKTILAKISRPLDINIGVAFTQDESLYGRALAFHFPQTPHRIRLRNYAVESGNPWVQDYLKAGRAGDVEKILVTRRLFEGRGADGELFRPMLDRLTEERFVRSKLSWEGGDLQFVEDPNHAGSNILFYGDSAKAYWGASLTAPEYEYVLKLEFGAGRAVDLSKLVPHVDYFVAFLARDHIALVSQPLTENFEAARAALDILVDHFEPMVPSELRELDRLFADRRHAFGDQLGTVRKLLNRATKAAPGWPRIEDGNLGLQLGQYLTKNCATTPEDCLAGGGLSHLLNADLPLARRWVSDGLRSRTDENLLPRLLSVIQSQLPGFRVETQPGIDAAVAELEKTGFRVIRVPRLGGDRSLAVPWSGISYANAVLVDDQLFVPAFGLGKFEDEVFAQLQQQLPSQYKVVPVYARHMMLFNGGTHCVLAIVRKATSGAGLRPAQTPTNPEAADAR
jgi:Porphyromonas-type peptidyl-arginine deiminase